MKTKLSGQIISRILFFAIPVFTSWMRWKYLSPPDDGGPSGPGDGFVIILDAMVSTIFFLPLCFLFWKLGFADMRFRKTLLMFVMSIVDLPLVVIFIFIISLQIRFLTIGHY